MAASTFLKNVVEPSVFAWVSGRKCAATAASELTKARCHANDGAPASFGSRAELAKSRFMAAKATRKIAEAMNLKVIWAETCRSIVKFISSIYSMMLVMRHQRQRKLVAGEWPGRRVGKLGREHGLAATVPLQFSLIQGVR